MVGCAPPPPDVGAQQQGVVVQHLLEVGDHPARISRVAVKAAADLVVDATARHRLQAALRQLQALRVTAHQQSVEDRRGREFRGGAEAGVDQVEVGADRVDGGMHLRRRVGQGSGGQRSQVASDHVSPRDQRLPVGLPRLGQGLQHLAERRPAWLRFGWEIGSGEEWAAVGCEEGRQRPATRSLIHELRGRHEDLVQHRLLLPVHLDGDEVRVDELRGLWVFERLMAHHVTPVT